MRNLIIRIGVVLLIAIICTHNSIAALYQPSSEEKIKLDSIAKSVNKILSKKIVKPANIENLPEEFSGVEDGVIRGIVINEKLKLFLILIATSESKSPGSGKSAVDDLVTLTFSKEHLEKIVLTSTKEDLEGRLALQIALLALARLDDSEQLKETINGDEAKAEIIAAYKSIKLMYVKKRTEALLQTIQILRARVVGELVKP